MSTGSEIEEVPRWQGRWRWAFLAAIAVVAAHHLIGLAWSPPGLYLDEASIGYNAWTILHHGVDEHGASFPLYFTAFGEYKNPVYIYVLVPFMAVFGPSAAVVRLPAAIFGIVAAVALGDAGRRLTGSRVVGIVTLLGSAAMPWLAVESRLGFEVISMVACLAVMLWCLSLLGRAHDRLAFLGAGIAAAIAIFAYSTARLEIAILLAGSLLCWGITRKRRADWLAMVVPVLVAYIVLIAWGNAHPGALTSRLEGISITNDHPSLPVMAARFADNYVTYWSPSFLFLRGDQQLRHATGDGGMLLVTMLPVLVAGGVAVVRGWRGPAQRFLMLGALLGPASAALTDESVPHSLRDVNVVPFLILIMALGLRELLALLQDRRSWLVALAVAATVEAGAYTADLYTGWPARAAGVYVGFDVPDITAIRTALAARNGHTVWLSSQLGGDGIEARFITLPDPPDRDIGRQSTAFELSQVDIAELDAGGLGTPVAGDVLVLMAWETPPPGAVLLETETQPLTTPGVNRDVTTQTPIVRVYRLA
jgi:4-amino-4-deoxy-L-arabinose transferase-like glycosyltransferase